MMYSPMSAREARLLLALWAKMYGVPPRVVQNEFERARMQKMDKSGHVWTVGEEYIAVEDVKQAVRAKKQ